MGHASDTAIIKAVPEETADTADIPHRFTAAQRTTQLREFSELCLQMAEAFALHDPRLAGVFRSLNERASTLLDQGWRQGDLTALGADYPTPPTDWLSPKSLDYNGPRERWQDDVAEWYGRGRALALDLRAIAFW